MQAKSSVSNKPEAHPIGAKHLTLKEGSSRVKIYGTWSHSKITDPSTGEKITNFIPEYSVRYYIAGKKHQKRFTDLNKAKNEARSVLTKITNNESEALKLTGLDHSAYVEAKSLLNDLPDSPSLVVAIQEYVAAKKALQGLAAPLEQVAKDYVQRVKAIEKHISVAELVEQLIKAKENSNLSDHYLRTLRRLRRFGRDLEIGAHELTYEMLQLYIDLMVDRRGNPASPRTKRNYWKLINTLLQFGVKRKCVSPDTLSEVKGIDLPKDNPSEITIWKPSEFAEMLNATRPEIIPTLVLGGFAGIRTEEINRLEWKDVDLEKKIVKVSASNAKTRSRRIVPLCDAAVAWLKPYAAREGKVAYYSEPNKYAAAIMFDVRTARKLKGYFTDPEWRKNALRHSFISYRLAEVKNAHQVAIEAGNSENIILKNYRELVTEEEAQQLFSIFPEKAQKIIHISSSTISR